MSDHSDSAARGPHQSIVAADAREELTLRLFDRLWERYRQRVSYVANYEQVIADAGARFVNDHIAFRTFACQRPAIGIHSLARVFDALGYRAAGCYHFADKHLGAIHYRHPNPEFPKLFVSELKVWELSSAARGAIQRTVASHRSLLDEAVLSELHTLGNVPAAHREQLLQTLVDQFGRLPWDLPEKQDVLAVSEESQYAAWVLVHGYNVNHFTSLINSHGVARLADIEKTIDALQAAGVPMKPDIEGQRGSQLRQSATEAVQINVELVDGGQPVTMPWTYAYFELAERGEITDPESGQPIRFEGFLGPQATNLFEMTRLKNK